MAKNIAVYGIYPSRTMVEEAVNELKAAGFRNTDISVLLPEGGGTKDLGVAKMTKASEGTATGGGTGVVLGGALGWLTGIGMLAIPGIGPFIAAGPIMAALAGAGVGGIVGGITGGLIGMGIPEYEANRYEGRLKAGGILLSVHADDSDWRDKAKDILERTGAEDIGSKGETTSSYDAATSMSDTTKKQEAKTAEERREERREINEPPAGTMGSLGKATGHTSPKAYTGSPTSTTVPPSSRPASGRSTTPAESITPEGTRRTDVRKGPNE